MLRPSQHKGIKIWSNDEMKSYAGGFQLTLPDSGVAVQFSIHAKDESQAEKELHALMRKMLPVIEECLNGKNAVVLKNLDDM